MKKRSGGKIRPFTLVEILMVAGMICVIIVLIVVGYNGVYRSWAVRNTVAAMKNVHLVLERFRLENGYLPKKDSPEALSCSTSDADPARKALARDLLQTVHPYARDFDGTVKVFDDFGSKTQEGKIRPIYYIYPYKNTQTFALLSKGKDGDFDEDGDDIIYLPAGLSGKNLPPGFYLVKLDDDGDIQGGSDDIEPLAN